MIPVGFYIALAGFFGTTLLLVFYYRETGTKLEVRTNNVIEGKRKIVSESYLELVEKTIERFKTEKNLSDEQEEKLEEISYIRFRLNSLPNDLSKVVDKITFSVIYGVASVVSMISFPYISTIFPDVTVSIGYQIIVGVCVVLFTYRYLFDGLLSIYPLRKFEKLVNELERSKTFNRLQELME